MIKFLAALIVVWLFCFLAMFQIGMLEKQAKCDRDYYRRIEIVLPGYFVGCWLTEKVKEAK